MLIYGHESIIIEVAVILLKSPYADKARNSSNEEKTTGKRLSQTKSAGRRGIRRFFWWIQNLLKFYSTLLLFKSVTLWSFWSVITDTEKRSNSPLFSNGYVLKLFKKLITIQNWMFCFNVTLNNFHSSSKDDKTAQKCTTTINITNRTKRNIAWQQVYSLLQTI